MSNEEEVILTNTFDSSVPWKFHESYYLYEDINFRVVNEKGKKEKCNLNVYVFKSDVFGDKTFELTSIFHDNCPGSSILTGEDGTVYVFKNAYNDDYPSSNISVSDLNNNIDISNNYLGDRYTWIEVENIEESKEKIESEDKSDSSSKESDGNNESKFTDKSDDDVHVDVYDDYEVIEDIESLEDAQEILREIYKAETSYQKDMLEVQKNSFDISVVSLALNFCLVFLVGVIVGCSFAKSLWQKMNVG